MTCDPYGMDGDSMIPAEERDLADRVDAIFRPPSTPAPVWTPPSPLPARGRNGRHRAAERRLRQPCCCGHHRVAHQHYSRSTHCSECRCPRFDRAVTLSWIGAGFLCLSVWAATLCVVLHFVH